MMNRDELERWADAQQEKEEAVEKVDSSNPEFWWRLQRVLDEAETPVDGVVYSFDYDYDDE